jgi:thiamine-phosphate pyrophosphorylase
VTYTAPAALVQPDPRTARRRRLDSAKLYLCTDGRRERGDLAAFLDEVLAAGVDVVQLRQKHLEATEELTLLSVVREACRRHGALFAVNDRADLAILSGADILHVGQRDLSPAQARRLIGPDLLIGRSSHSFGQAAAAAADPDVDYYCIGPVWATPTKPGRAAAGLEAVEAVAAARPALKPWFAIGGIDEVTVADVTARGAARIVVVRAVTEAADPGAAVRRLRAALGPETSTAGPGHAPH